MKMSDKFMIENIKENSCEIIFSTKALRRIALLNSIYIMSKDWGWCIDDIVNELNNGGIIPSTFLNVKRNYAIDITDKEIGVIIKDIGNILYNLVEIEESLNVNEPVLMYYINTINSFIIVINAASVLDSEDTMFRSKIRFVDINNIIKAMDILNYEIGEVIL